MQSIPASPHRKEINTVSNTILKAEKMFLCGNFFQALSLSIEAIENWRVFKSSNHTLHDATTSFRKRDGIKLTDKTISANAEHVSHNLIPVTLPYQDGSSNVNDLGKGECLWKVNIFMSSTKLRPIDRAVALMMQSSFELSSHNSMSKSNILC